MDLHLAGKTAVVTAAAGGIGGAVVRTLVAEGARVLGADRSITPELRAAGAATVEADLTTADGVEKLRKVADATFGGVDLLVNAVGGLAGMPVTGLADMTDGTWKKAFELNFYSTVRVTRALLPHLQAAV